MYVELTRGQDAYNWSLSCTRKILNDTNKFCNRDYCNYSEANKILSNVERGIIYWTRLHPAILKLSKKISVHERLIIVICLTLRCVM